MQKEGKQMTRTEFEINQESMREIEVPRRKAKVAAWNIASLLSPEPCNVYALISALTQSLALSLVLHESKPY